MGEHSEADPEIMRFYDVVRGSYTRQEMHDAIVRTDLAVRLAKIRGLIPWDYDGEREYVQRRTTYGELRSFDFPEPPEWGNGEAA